MPIIPRYQSREGPRIQGLDYAGAYQPPGGDDWRMLAQVASAAGSLIGATRGSAGGAEPDPAGGGDTHASSAARPQASGRAGQGPSSAGPARTGRGFGQPVGGIASSVASSVVAAGSSVADAFAIAQLNDPDSAAAIDPAKVVADAYQPAIAAASSLQERHGLEANRDSLTDLWVRTGRQLQTAQAEIDRDVIAEKVQHAGLEAIGKAPTFEAVEGIADRQMAFGEVFARDGGGASAPKERLSKARALRLAAERRKAELDPERYLALTGSEGLAEALGATDFALSDDQILAEAEAIGRPDLLALAPDVLASRGREDDLPELALESRYDRALQYYGGDQTLAITSVLAGRETVDGWLASIGDPRDGAISYADFRRAIPDATVRDRLAAVETSLFGSLSSLLSPQDRADIRGFAKEQLELREQEEDRQLVSDAESGRISLADLQADGVGERYDVERPAVRRAIQIAARREKREAEQRDDAALMGRVLGGERLELDMDNPAHRRALDSHYAKFRASKPDIRFADAAVAYAGATGQLPTAANDQLDRMLLSSDPKALAEAAEVFVRLEAVDPDYLNGLSPRARTRGGYLRDRWKESESLSFAAGRLKARDSMGEPEVAQRNSWFDKAMREDPQAGQRILRQELFGDAEVQAFKDVPGTLRQYNPVGGARHGAMFVPSAMMADLNNVARSRYRDHLDLQRAYREAYNDVRKRWQPSYINGRPEFMRMPPDRIFAIDGEPPSKTARWQRIQAGWRFKISEPSRIRFREPPGPTNRGKPQYEIWIADHRGVEVRVHDWKTNKPAVWTPDVAGESAHRNREEKRWDQATRDYEDEKAARRRWKARRRAHPQLRLR